MWVQFKKNWKIGKWKRCLFWYYSCNLQFIFLFFLNFLLYFKPEIKRDRLVFDELQDLLENVEFEFKKTAELFGENPQILQPDQLFEPVIQFTELFTVN